MKTYLERMKELNKRKSPKSSEFQNTPAYAPQDGIIVNENAEERQGLFYDDKEINILREQIKGTDLSGNLSIYNSLAERKYATNGVPYANVVGENGRLHIVSESELMSQEYVKVAADYWNRIAGDEIVVVVDTREESDEVIHDGFGREGTALAATTFDEGVEVYPDHWAIGEFTQPQLNNQIVKTAVHEVGHSMGITHLGGGLEGANGGDGNEFMTSNWSPYNHPEGITNSTVDATCLALAAMTWKYPRMMTSWVMGNPDSKVNVNDMIIDSENSTIPYGIDTAYDGGAAGLVQSTDFYLKKITQEVQVFAYSDFAYLCANKYYRREQLLGTTNDFNLTGKEVVILDHFDKWYIAAINHSPSMMIGILHKSGFGE